MYMEMVVFRSPKQNSERPSDNDNRKRYDERAERNTVHADNSQCCGEQCDRTVC